MLESFLFDYKRKISVFNTMRGIDCIRWVLLLAGLGVLLWSIHNSYFILVLVSVLSLIGIVCWWIRSNPPHQRKNCEQLQWFRKYRVDIVTSMINEDISSLPKGEFIDFLLEECDNKLKEIRPSKIVKKRLAPVNVLISIISTALLTAYLCDELSITDQIEGCQSFIEWFTKIMPELSKVIISNENILTLFVIMCFCALFIYLAIVFIVLPIIVSVIDRDWLLTKELKSVLLYIKRLTPHN